MSPAELSADVFAVRGVDDPALERRLHEAGVALTVGELRRIAEALGRDPSTVELYAFDAQWSEHCSYKSSRHLLQRLPTEGPTVMQGPAEDAGVLHLGEWQGVRYGVVIAHESHNHPSQVVPFEGAATGVGGIVRDVLCMGATVIALADGLRFGRLENAHCRYVAQSVVDGIGAYGNAIGVPTIAGDVYVDEGFDDNVLVNVVALGLVKEGEIIHSRAPEGSVGWDIVLIGKATDRSGFGGASFSSLTLDPADAQQNRGAVQVPDPFLKNVLMRASYRVFDALREAEITAGFKDLGAGGIVGCTAELVAAGGLGAMIDLDRAPTAQPNLPPAVIAMGETQERLAWVVPPAFTPRLLQIYNEEFGLPAVARGACAAVIGQVVAEPTYTLRWHERELMAVPLDVFTGGIRYDREAAPLRRPQETSPPVDVPVAQTLVRLLSHRDVCSRRPLFERFDSVVRGTTSIPCGDADAGVIVPIPGAPLGVALAVDGNPRYGRIDPRLAAAYAVCEGCRNVVAVGARPVGLTDCLNFGDPERPEHFAALVEAVEGLAEAARALGTPFVSGNVSLYNAAESGKAIPPSPIVATVGAIADISKTASATLKRAGSALMLVGARSNALGASVVADLDMLRDTTADRIVATALPPLNFAAVRAELAFMLAAFDQNLVLAAHDISDGGLVTAVAEMALATLAQAPLGAALASCEGWAPGVGGAGALFGEAGGFVVEVTSEAEFAALAAQHGVEVWRAGTVTAEPLLVIEGEAFALDELERIRRAPFAAVYETAAL